jgi:hypothetical protein
MILNIDPDPEFRFMIWRTVIIALVCLTVYGILWMKFKVKRPPFLPMPVDEIMAMQAKAEEEQRIAWEARLAAKDAATKGGGGNDTA